MRVDSKEAENFSSRDMLIKNTRRVIKMLENVFWKSAIVLWSSEFFEVYLHFFLTRENKIRFDDQAYKSQ